MIPSIISDLLEACKKSGCPVCRVENQRVDHYIQSVFYEKVNDRELRAYLRESLAFCNRHAWRATEPGLSDALGVAIIYNDVLGNVLKQVPAGQPAGGAGMRLSGLFGGAGRNLAGAARRLVQRLIPGRPCPVCVQEEEIYRLVLSELLEAFHREDLQRALQGSSGLCLPHLRQALETSQDEATQAALIALEREKIEALRAELGEFIRKNDYRFRGETFGPERDAWKRAIRMVNGEKKS